MRKLRRAHLHDEWAGPHWAGQGRWQGLGEAETRAGHGPSTGHFLESRGRNPSIATCSQPVHSARLRNLFTPSTLAQLLPTMACLREMRKSVRIPPAFGFWCQVVMNWGPLAVEARDSQMEPRSRTGAPFRPATTPGDVIGGQSKPLSTLTHLSAHCFQSTSLAKGAISALAVGHLSIRDGLTLQQSSSQHSQMLPLAPGKSWHHHGHPRPLRLAVRCASAWRCGPCGTLDEPPEASWRWTECSVHGRSRPACHNGRPLPRTVDKLTSQRLKTAAPQLEPFAAS